MVTRRGRLAGVFFSRPEATLPIELKRELFAMLSAAIARQIKKRDLKEDDILSDFKACAGAGMRLAADANVLLSCSWRARRQKLLHAVI